MMYEPIPKWINRFSLKIEDENKTMLLIEEDTNPNNVRFFDSLGAEVGNKVLIKDKEYIIKKFQLYSGMNLEEGNVNLEYGYGFDLHIIVEEV